MGRNFKHIYQSSCRNKKKITNDIVPSEITSLNQNAIEPIKDKKPNVKKYPPLEKPCIVNTNILIYWA